MVAWLCAEGLRTCIVKSPLPARPESAWAREEATR